MRRIYMSKNFFLETYSDKNFTGQNFNHLFLRISFYPDQFFLIATSPNYI